MSEERKGSLMNDIISTTSCYECSGVMEGRRGEYKYVECGLKSVVLKDILIFRCRSCSAVVPEIPAAGVLHRVIALRLLSKESLLTGDELKFMRKLCGYSVTEFAQIMGSSKNVVSRWENHNTHGKETDRIVRLVTVAKLTGEAAGNEPILQNVTVQSLNKQIENALKTMVSKKRAQKLEINPEELKQFGNCEHQEQLRQPTLQ
jgi:DNA-binding transcriptional regulator YiaG